MSTMSGPLNIIPGNNTAATNKIQLCKSGTDHTNPTVNMSIVGAANAAASYVPTVTNASHGQASTYTIQDYGVASANIAVASAALVSGNLVQASGTKGNLADSGITSSSLSSLITQVGNVTTVSVTLLPAQMTVAYDTPVQLIAAPGSGKTIIIQEACIFTDSTGHTAYATGTAPVIQYDSTAHGVGTAATSSGLVAGDITAASSQIRCVTSPTSALTGVTNKGIFFSNATGNYTNGTGTNVTFTITYQVLTATV